LSRRPLTSVVRTKRPHISPAKGHIYHLGISLLHVEPEIWRRVEVGDITLAKLHGIIQNTVGWTHSHLHLYRTEAGEFTDPRFGLAREWQADIGDSRRIRLSDLLQGTSDTFIYEYDFGDTWQHRIACEAIREFPAGALDRVPARCLAGARACPPEDCGGADGYAQLLRVLNDPEDPEHEHLVEWSTPRRGGHFDPDYFDLKLVNQLLAI